MTFTRLSTFAGLLAPFRRQVAYVAALSFITNIMMLVPTIYMLQLYDRVMMSHNSLTLVAVTLMVFFLLLLMALAEWLRSSVVIKSGIRFDQIFGQKIFSLAFSDAHSGQAGSGGQQAGQALENLTLVRQFITGNGLFAFFDVPWSVLYIAVLFILSPVLGGLAIVLCTIQFGLAVWNQRSTAKPLQTLASAQLKTSQFLQGKLRNLETLHVMGLLPQLYQRWAAHKQQVNQYEDAALQCQHRNQFVNKWVRYTMQSIMLAVAALLTIQGKISVGSMIASNVLIGRALQPFDVIVTTWRQYMQAKIAAVALNRLLAKPAAGKSETHSLRTLSHQILGHIHLNNISVHLTGTRQATLQDLNLHIQPGRILNIMGASGSGKTTLARTLVGLLVPTQGELTIDKLPLASIDATELAAAIGYLPQQVALIEGTIAENIARFGTLDTQSIIAASQAAGMHDMVLRMPAGYDTRIDESGAPLSGGQRQLIGLARAVYQSPGIIVLDEPNAHLDESGEAHLLAMLQRLKADNKTIVVISHRSGLLKITDDLLILKEGRIAQFGPRDAGVAYLNQLRSFESGLS